LAFGLALKKIFFDYEFLAIIQSANEVRQHFSEILGTGRWCNIENIRRQSVAIYINGLGLRFDQTLFE
jgi:hypothetical protein